jgi:hypothetical protein
MDEIMARFVNMGVLERMAKSVQRFLQANARTSKKILSLLAVTLMAAPALAQTSSPVVVELFTSQGCSSCPPANATLGKIADRADVLALSFAVTYWDYLGWKDTFGDAQYTARQSDYASGLHNSSVYTPQMVIDGRFETTGQSVTQLEPFIAKAKTIQKSGPAIVLKGDQIVLNAAPAKTKALVWLVWYDPRNTNVPIGRGENSGRTLPHRNVVRGLTLLGNWSGAAAQFKRTQPADSHYRAAVLVQSGRGGPIIAAAKL